MRLTTSVYSLLTLTTTIKNQTKSIFCHLFESNYAQNTSNWFGSWLYLHIVHKIIGGNYGLKLDFDFWCHPGNKSISRKVQHVKTPLIFDKIEFCCIPAQYVEWEIFLTPSLESVFQWHSWSAFCRFSQWCQVSQASLMLYVEFKRAFEFESEFILVYMTKWQPVILSPQQFGTSLSQYLGKSLCNTSKTSMTLEPFYTLLLNQTLYIHSEQATVFANSFQ